MTKIITLHSPKTSGCTAISLNIAIAHKFTLPQKIAFLQLTKTPDLHLQIGTKPLHNIENLVSFLETEEWNNHLLNQIKQNKGIDFFFSPKNQNWKNLSLKNFKLIFKLIEKNYEIIYLDLNDSIPKEIKEFVLEKSNQIHLLSSIDPLSLNAVKCFWKNNQKFHKKIKLILNQCPKGKEREIKNRFLGIEIPFLESLISEPTTMWHQIYEGVPIIFQKKSKLKKQILKLVKHINL